MFQQEDTEYFKKAKPDTKSKSFYFDSFGIGPPVNIHNQLQKPFVYSTYQIQTITEKYCAAYCLYILFLVSRGVSFEEAVLELFFQRKRGEFISKNLTN